MPRSVAHSLAEFKKALLTELTTALQWEMEWIDNRVAGGDKLREEWCEKRRQYGSSAS